MLASADWKGWLLGSGLLAEFKKGMHSCGLATLDGPHKEVDDNFA
jgi:hypothetical protein